MRILLFGGSGQLGLEIKKRALDLDFELVSPVLSEVDISEAQQVHYLARKLKPDLIINSAAYTAVDKAESDKDAAFRINRDGARNAALAAREVGCRLLYVSTDYVFNGTATAPISEEAATSPINVYGESKLAGERETLNILGDQAVVVRTSSLHGAKGVNFVQTMLDLFVKMPAVKVVQDQIMSPTWAGWLADTLLDLGRVPCSGVYHACCAGAVSWYDFAREIQNVLGDQLSGIGSVVIEPIAAADFARPAKRPQYSVMDCAKLASLLGRKPIPWQEGLRGHLRDLGYEV